MKFIILFVSLFVLSCTQVPKKEEPAKPKIDATSKKLGRAKFPKDKGFEEYGKSVKTRLRILPRKVEREFTQGYVDYMLTGDPRQGQKLIKLLKENVMKNNKKFDSEWISIFGGGEKLKAKKINLGVMSSTRLMKLISFGDPTSIEFLVIYSASVELNEEDSARIRSYSNIVKSSYKEILKASILKNQAFLLDYPQEL